MQAWKSSVRPPMRRPCFRFCLMLRINESARNVPREYEVYYTINYSVENGSQSIVDPQSLTLTRDYTYDETLVLGKAREAELLRDAIVDDLVRIILKQLAAL